MAVTRLIDVAEDAGVSLATASRVLNGSARVPGEQVAERVRESALRLGYVTNAQAQALTRAHSGMIGLVVHDISDPYFSTIAREIQLRTFQSSTQLLLAQTNRDLETESLAIRSLVAQRASAIILVGSHHYGSAPDAAVDVLLEHFVDNGGRVISVGQQSPVGSSIVTGDADGARSLAQRLIDQGHRRFGLVRSRQSIPAMAERTEGFLTALNEAGLDPEIMLDATFDRQGGHRLGESLADYIATTTSEDPLCFFAPADVLALALMGQLRREGLKVPEQVAVAGYGGVPSAEDSHPTLTTLALPLSDLAEHAVALALGESEGESGSVEYASHEVLLRDSTRL